MPYKTTLVTTQRRQCYKKKKKWPSEKWSQVKSPCQLDDTVLAVFFTESYFCLLSSCILRPCVKLLIDMQRPHAADPLGEFQPAKMIANDCLKFISSKCINNF